MDYELELKNEKLECMIIVYEKHIEELELENKQLKAITCNGSRKK